MHLNEEEPEAFLPQPGAPKVLPGQITTVGVTCSPFLAVKGIGAFTHIFFSSVVTELWRLGGRR